jgi:hypothetical protein
LRDIIRKILEAKDPRATEEEDQQLDPEKKKRRSKIRDDIIHAISKTKIKSVGAAKGVYDDDTGSWIGGAPSGPRTA